MMYKSFRLPELEVAQSNVYSIWYRDTQDMDPQHFSTYEEAICYAYNRAYNGAIELSLESMIKLTKEYNKVEVR